MGCETDVPSEEPEAAHSLVVTSLETKRNDIFEDSKSVTIYNRLGLGISKMATGNLKDFESECHERLGLVNEALNCNDIDGYESNVHDKGLTENQSVANKRNEGQSDPDIGDQIKKAQSNMTEQGESNRAENLNETTTEVHTNASEKELDPLNSLTIKLPVTNDSQDEGSSRSGGLSDVKIREEILNNLEILKDRLKTATDIPSILLDVSLSSLKPSTIEYMSYHLDPQSDVMSPEDKLKDYRGMAEWIGLEPVFIKYISRSPYMLKTKEVLSKWLTLEEEPLPTLKNLRTCLLAIDRPDVLEDMSVKIALDAVTWKKTQIEAQTKKEVRVDDTSWQLTRHDVVSGSPVNYTCCLVYADEDEGMAQIFTKLYKTVYPNALFFLPQFDLKQGKFIHDTTAQVIEERCGGKVIFFISEYFFASTVCRFTVNFCKDMESSTQEGNMIPFHLTNNFEHVPRVLKGIAGIKWYRKSARKKLWLMLTDSLLGGKMKANEIEELKIRMETIIEKEPDCYLSDPPYDESTPIPGDPISVYDPPPEVENSDDPSSHRLNPDEDECLMSKSLSSLEASGYVKKKSNLTRVAHYVRKNIFRRVVGSRRERQRAPLPSSAHQPPIEIHGKK